MERFEGAQEAFGDGGPLRHHPKHRKSFRWRKSGHPPIFSEKEECLARFVGLLDAGGYNIDEAYKPESPYRGEENPDVEGVAGRDVPEFQAIAPALEEDEVADIITVNDVNVSAHSSVEVLRTAGRFLGVSTSRSKAKIFRRIRETHISALRLRALEVARGECETMRPHPRFQDAHVQPSIQKRELHEVTHIPCKKWCSVCIQAKSCVNHQRPTPPDDLAQRVLTLLRNATSMWLWATWTF